MKHVLYIAFLCIGLMAGTLHAEPSDKPMFGRYDGSGRACFGALFLRKDTIEWNATYSDCGPSAYTEADFGHDQEGRKRYGFILKKPGKKCNAPVIVMTKYESDGSSSWSVDGYMSLKEEKMYRKKTPPMGTGYLCSLTYSQ